MKRIAQLLIAGVAATGPAFADGHDSLHAQVEILPGWRAEAGTHIAALRVTLDEGWKTYWRAPGEAGLPPQFDWSGSGNVAGVVAHWPVPEVFLSSGMTTLGYHDELILPLEITPADPAADIALTGNLAMGICENICVPIQAEVAAVLSAADTSTDPRIRLALDRQPAGRADAGLVEVRCDIEPISDGMRVTAQFEMPALGTDELAVVEAADPAIWVSSAVSKRSGDVLTAVADLVPPSVQSFDLDPQTLRFTVMADGRAVDIQGCDTTN